MDASVASGLLQLAAGTSVAFLSRSVFFESKPGPYVPPGPDELAAWAPQGAPECANIERGWRELFPPRRP